MEKIFVLTGEIVHGKGLGRTVGMPTANLAVHNQQLPAPGVYATQIIIGEQRYDSVTNIGTRPSVDQEEYETVETCILDFEADIYGKQVVLEGVRFLRPIQRFASLQEVQAQVQIDIKESKNIFNNIKEDEV